MASSSGSPPFLGENPAAVFASIRELKIQWQKLKPCRDPTLEDLIRSLLNPDQMERLGSGPEGIEAVKEHAYFQGLKWDTVSTTPVR